MIKKVLNIIHIFWPPLEAAKDNRVIAESQQHLCSETEWAVLKQNTEAIVRDDFNLNVISALSEEIANSEFKRKEVLEAKASTVVQAAGVTVSIVSLAPVFVVDYSNLPWCLAVLAIIAYGLSVLHLTVAVYYAFLVRRVQGFMLPCYDGFVDLLTKEEGALERRIAVDRVLSAKFNQGLLDQKNNYLSASEDLFLRGIALFVFAATASLASKAFLIAG